MKKTLLSAFVVTAAALNTAYAESPYSSEMPATIGAGAHKIEYEMDYNRLRHRPVNVEEYSITQHDLSYTYGATPNIDLSINLPFDSFYYETTNNMVATANGTKVQDLELALKGRYYQTPSAEMAAKVTVLLPTGDEKHINSARSYGKANVEIKLANRFKATEALSMHNNIAFTTNNRKGAAKNSSFVTGTLGASYKFTPEFSGIVDAGYSVSTRDSDESLRFATVGAQYHKNGFKAGLGFKVSRQDNTIMHTYNTGLTMDF